MLKEERQQLILENLRRDGKVIAKELCATLNTSEDTVRRDLAELAEQDLLQRVHGGALLRSPGFGSYSERQQQSPEAKASIARAAVQLIRTGQVVLLDGGTTNLHVARNLPPNLNVTIITNSPPVATTLAEHPLVNVVLLGGQLDKESIVTTGAAVVDTLRQIRADLYLIGICSLHPEAGISMSNLEEVYIKRAMINCSAEVVALASPEKIGTAGPYIVGPISELDYLVTEKSVPEEALGPYKSQGVTIIRG